MLTKKNKEVLDFIMNFAMREGEKYEYTRTN